MDKGAPSLSPSPVPPMSCDCFYIQVLRLLGKVTMSHVFSLIGFLVFISVPLPAVFPGGAAPRVPLAPTLLSILRPWVAGSGGGGVFQACHLVVLSPTLFSAPSLGLGTQRDGVWKKHTGQWRCHVASGQDSGGADV